MSVQGALRGLEKIEMIKGVDGIYRLDHAATVIQKKILKAFNMDEYFVALEPLRPLHRAT